jgi:hypothetical protein
MHAVIAKRIVSQKRKPDLAREKMQKIRRRIKLNEASIE